MDEQSKESLAAEIKNANEVIKKLKTFTNELEKTGTDNILTHLCDGLEKFLGYDKTSKGYDGTGIVYSDLDRLCDGVMGFLSGVLSAVKNENEVETYDKHLDKRLNEVLKEVNKKMGSGRAGLAASVGAVKGWLEGYGNKIRDMTFNVKNALTILQDDLSGKYLSRINSAQNLEEQLNQWNGVLKDIDFHLNETETNGVNVLDSKLRNDVMHEFKVIQKSVQVMKESAEEKWFGDQVKQVDEQLTMHRDQLLTNIQEQSERLRKMLHGNLWTIFEKLGDLNRTKKNHFENIYGKLKGLSDVNDNFNRNYLDVISNRFEELKHIVQGVHGNLMADKTLLEGLVQQAQTALGAAKTNIQASTRTTNDKSIEHNWRNIQWQIADLVSKMNGNGFTRDGLQGIAKEVEMYTRKFTGRMFDMVIQEWIKKSVEDDIIVKHRLGEYHSNNQSHLSISGITQLHSYIISTIKQHLGPIMKGIGDIIQGNIKRDGTNSINENIHAVIAGIEQFRSQLDTQLNTGVIQTVLRQIVTDIEDNLQRNFKLKKMIPYISPNFDLQLAVESILAGLRSKAIHNLEQMNKLITQFHLGNVNDAICIVRKINEQIDGKASGYTSGFGNKIDEALQALSIPINQLTQLLDLSGSEGSIKYMLTNESKGLKKVLAELDDIKNEKGSDSKDGKIEQQKKGAEQKMKELKQKLNENVFEIRHAVAESESLLQSAIDAVKHSLSEAEKITKEAVDSHIHNLTSATMNAFEEIIRHVRILFANNRVAELQALRKLVSTHSVIVKRIIHNDKRTGLKGLLKTVEGIKVTINQDRLPQFNQPPDTTLLERLHKAVESVSTPFTKDEFTKASKKFQAYFYNVHMYVDNQLRPQHGNPNVQLLTDVNTNFTDLLEHLKTNSKPLRTYLFDHTYTNLHSTLSSSLHLLSPSAFANPRHPELLDAVKKGLEGFVGEMERVYVNGYDGKTIKWTENEGKEDKLTVHGKNCAKVFLNVLSILHTEFNRLVKYCQSSSRSEQINKSTNVGMFFLDQGYDVSDDGKQNGELQDDMRMTVFFIYKRLFGFDDRHIYKKDKFNQEIGALKTLHEHLQTYYQLGHVATSSSKRRPCSIFEMLCWLSGLPCNTVYEELWRDAVSDLFIDPKKQPTEDDEIPVTVVSEELPAYPQAIELANTQKAVKRLCSRSYDVLIKIVGYGNEYTQYAVEYCDNSLRLSYPSDPSQCLELLLDILHRLLPVFRFLYSRCKLSVQHGGWQECEYGKNIRTTKWPCKEHITDEVACQANDQPNTKPKCQPTSPLMSYLNDCLPGHLPHQLSSIGCKYDCATCPSTFRKGQPCLTPLGFRGFSGSTKTGKDLCSMLSKMIADKHLTSLFCLVTKPPKTLPEHFEFALSLVGDWIQGAPMNRRTNEPTVQSSFESSINKLSINLCKSSALNNALMSAYGSQSVAHESCDDHHLRNLATADICHGKQNAHVKVAPYVASLCCDSYYYLAYKSTDTYASWAIYLPWTFWDLLNNLYNDFCNIFCADWGCRKCLRGDKCRPGQHGLVDDKTDIPHCSCTSIIGCKGVSPLFYKYGLVFGNASELNKSDFRKTCSDFCSQLKNVLQSQYFKNLFRECDEFLWTIREPFTYLVLALWSLSLFYLICVMVGRLDVLHIRSHLRIPSSHKITAQSLLAAAQVGRLAKISYLQP